MTKKAPKGKSLAEVNPELAKEWHPIKNGLLSPFDVFYSSRNVVWWKCEKEDDHEWQVDLNSRARGNGCPMCRGLRIVKSNSLSTLNPDLAKEWHPTKNGKLTPNDVGQGSSKKVWWKCDRGDDHEWEARVSKRGNGQGCPVCLGRKVVLSNCLATLNPDLAKEWHPTKNGKLKSTDVVPNSNKKVWWKCDKEDDHEWIASIDNRTKGKNCPMCSGRKVVMSNCLATVNPDLAKEWHPTKNGKLTPNDVVLKSNKKVWWKCGNAQDHEWFVTINNRSNGRGCPYCSNQRITYSNSLAVLNPDLASDWHPTKNGKFTPADVGQGSHKKVWWKCDKGDDHQWIARISERLGGNGCPVCRGLKVVTSNCLATLNPDLAKEWHPTKNGKLTPNDVVLKSNKKVWWKCKRGIDHEFLTAISARSNGTECPYCTLTPQSKQELTITFELIKFFEINPKGFKTRVQGKLWSIDIYIPELNLGIEFDGSYWHKDKRDLDKLKTEKLEDDGFKIMRIREEPLKAITQIDVVSITPFNPKVVTNEILTHILEAYTLESKKIKKIEKYLLKEEIQNEKELDAYIDMILTEKTEKKSS